MKNELVVHNSANELAMLTESEIRLYHLSWGVSCSGSTLASDLWECGSLFGALASPFPGIIMSCVL